MGEQQLGCYVGVKQAFDVGYYCVSVIGHGNNMEGVSCMLVDVLEACKGMGAAAAVNFKAGQAWELAFHGKRTSAGAAGR